MTFGPRGYFALTIPPQLLAECPAHVLEAWKPVQVIQERVTVARQERAALENAARTAPESDERAALEAVVAGKPVPKPTAPRVQEEFDTKVRQVKALEQIADDTEREFLLTLLDAQPEIEAAMRPILAEHVRKAQEAMTAFLEASDQAAVVSGIWRWARRGDDTVPRSLAENLTMTFDGTQQPLGSWCDSLTNVVNRLDPAVVEDREAMQAALASAQPRATADGLVVDHAASKEWNS